MQVSDTGQKERKGITSDTNCTAFAEYVGPISTNTMSYHIYNRMSHLHQGDLPVGGQGVVEHLCGREGENPPRARLRQLASCLPVQLILHP